MPVRPVLKLPARVLKEVAESVTFEEQEALVSDLVDTMRVSPACVGLAAPQIGVGLRAFALDVSRHPKTTTCHGLIVMFNPTIVDREGNDLGREGCMSVPGLTASVRRYTRITVTGSSPSGEEIKVSTEGFEARAFQHEIDHLDGLLILDRVDSLATDIFRRRIYK